MPAVPERYSHITISNTIYTFQVSIKCILSMLFCVTELPLTPSAIFTFSPFFALVPAVPGLYSRITISNTIYTFQVSIKCILSTSFCVTKLPSTPSAIFTFSAVTTVPPSAGPSDDGDEIASRPTMMTAMVTAVISVPPLHDTPGHPARGLRTRGC